MDKFVLSILSYFRSLSHTFLIAIVALCWLTIETALYLYYGTQLSVDSSLYIDNAYNILAGVFPAGREFWYSSYSFFLAVIFWCGGNATTVVWVQIIFSGVATACLYKLATDIFADRYIAFVTCILYVGWVKIHQWDTFVYTESLYTSFSIISFTMLVRSRGLGQYILAISMIVLTFFIRPTGYCFAVALVVYGIVLHRDKLTRTQMVAVGVSLTLAALWLLNRMLTHYTVLESYAMAEVIYPKISLGMQPPADLYQPESGSPLFRLASFIVHNPVYFLKLWGTKLIVFMANVKPYFSWMHNAMLVLILYPLYYFAVRGYLYFPKGRSEKYFILTYVVAQSLTVSLTTENWDGRFLVPLLPFIFILSSVGICVTLRKNYRDV